ncbi:MAG: sigma-54-dependent Fis family transcriptional regulator [Acidobacteria bacterium]|nr:sigma-54-dependent Fis family transcriptional regulator [Acidobacteriota bacterium]
MPDSLAYLGCQGESAHARELQSFITQAAQQVHPVLLLGEAGLRQEELARALHQASAQARQPFIAINAHALSEEALHLLLFGEMARPGVLQSLARGTVFVNELTRLSPRLHQRLGVYLEERHWLRDEAAEQRLILVADVTAAPSATESRVAQGLLELLRPYRVVLRPLRERRADLPAIAGELLRRLTEQANRRALTLSPKALEAMTDYDWPENLEELAGVLRAALAQVPPHQVTDECLPTRIRFAQLRTLPESGIEMSQLVEDYERNLLTTALRQTGNSQTKAARLLGVRVQTLNMKLKRLAEQGTPLL